MLSGCRAETSVSFDLNNDGTGEVKVSVALDKAAVEYLGPLGLDGLSQGGWEVDGPEPVAGGGATYVATKRFRGAAQAESAIAEVGGGLRDFEVQQRRGFWRTTTAVTGTVDLRDFAAAVSDSELTALLGSPLGLSAAELDTELGGPASERLVLDVAVDLPGAQSGSASATVHPGERATISTATTATNLRVLVPMAFSVGLAAAAIFTGVRVVRRARRIRAIQEM